jgi:hypothetical protein
LGHCVFLTEFVQLGSDLLYQMAEREGITCGGRERFEFRIEKQVVLYVGGSVREGGSEVRSGAAWDVVTGRVDH